MSHVDGRNAAVRPTPSPAGRPFPFWVLQLAELIAAVVLVEVSVHVRGGGTLIATSVALALLAALAQGPLGLLRICPQRLHVALVVVVAALAAGAPAVPALRPDIEGIIVLEFAAVGLIRVATLTRTSEQAGGTSRNRRRAPVIDTTASVVDPAARSRPPTGTSGASSARGAPTESAARRAGRTAGAAAASGRRLAATHRPTAEAHLKRSIRGAGRWAGRFTSTAPERRPPET